LYSSLHYKQLINNQLQLESQLEQIVKMNAELRRKNIIHKKQAKTLLEERVDMEAQLVDKDHQIKQITDLIKDHEIEQTQPQSEVTKQISVEVVHAMFSCWYFLHEDCNFVYKL